MDNHIAHVFLAVISGATRVLCLASPSAALVFCVWITMQHASEFAGRTSVVKVEVAIAMTVAMTVSLVAGGGGIAYGIHQMKLRKQAQQSHASETETLKTLLTNVVNNKTASAKGGQR